MSEKVGIRKEVERKFRLFLMANELRQTPERFAILDAIYSIQGYFTIEFLQDIMQERRFPVSSSTLYRTTQLLVQANLLIQHPFNATAVFERIEDKKPKSYQICNNCHKITRIASQEVAEGIMAYHPRFFSINHSVAYVYGICPSCQKEMNKKIKKLEKEKERQKERKKEREKERQKERQKEKQKGKTKGKTKQKKI